MGILTGLSRLIVVLLNIVFMIVSFLLIAVGVIAYLAEDIPQIKSIDETIQEQVKQLATSSGGTNSGIESFSIAELLDDIGVPLIVLGCLLLPLTFFGCCGACYKFRTLLFIYGLIVTVLLLGEIIVVILMYAAPNTIQGLIKANLRDTLANFKGSLGSDLTSLSWMFAMKQMKCCGVDGYQDFKNYAPNWDDTPNNAATIHAPLACCKSDPSDSNMDCARTGVTFDIHTEGCFDAVWNAVLGNPLYAYIGYGAAFVFQLLLIIFSILMYRDIKKNQSDDKMNRNNRVHPRY